MTLGRTQLLAIGRQGSLRRISKSTNSHGYQLRKTPPQVSVSSSRLRMERFFVSVVSARISDIGLGKVVAFKQQWFIACDRGSECQAVPKI